MLVILFCYSNSHDFRQSFGGSISITAQCIENQPMPNETSGKDLQIMYSHFYVRSLLHGGICVTKCKRPSNCFFLFFFFLSSSPGHFSVNDLFTVSKQLALRFHETSHVYSWVVCALQCKILLTSRLTLTFQGHNYIKSHFGPYLGFCLTNCCQILTQSSLGRCLSIDQKTS